MPEILLVALKNNVYSACVILAMSLRVCNLAETEAREEEEEGEKVT